VAIKKHHVLYAARNGLLPLLVLFPALGLIVWKRGGTLIDFFYGSVPLAFLCFGNFAYWLWRTQRDLPPERK
jgi:hypothetical protein